MCFNQKHKKVYRLQATFIMLQRIYKYIICISFFIDKVLYEKYCATVRVYKAMFWDMHQKYCATVKAYKAMFWDI